MHPANHVLFIHDAWLRSASLARLRARFEAHGFETSAPSWPGERTPDCARTTLGAIVDHHAAIIARMPSAPLVVGHGYGGLVAQLLLDRGLGAGAVAIAPEPITGVLSGARAFWSALPVLTEWGAWNRRVRLPYLRFATDLAQTLSEGARHEAYEDCVIPAPGRIFFQCALGIETTISGRPDRAPLLLLAAEEDRVVDSQMVYDAFLVQNRAHPRAATDFKSFAGRSHFLVAELGCDDLADYAMQWATATGAARAHLRLVSSRPAGPCDAARLRRPRRWDELRRTARGDAREDREDEVVRSREELSP